MNKLYAAKLSQAYFKPPFLAFSTLSSSLVCINKVTNLRFLELYNVVLPQRPLVFPRGTLHNWKHFLLLAVQYLTFFLLATNNSTALLLFIYFFLRLHLTIPWTISIHLELLQCSMLIIFHWTTRTIWSKARLCLHLCNCLHICVFWFTLLLLPASHCMLSKAWGWHLFEFCLWGPEHRAVCGLEHRKHYSQKTEFRESW